jgi:hypothetical protein
MADDRPTYETLLDFLVYAPLGAAMVAVAEVPRLAEVGRERMEKQVAVARLIGRFAVAEGRRRFGAGSSQPPRRETSSAEQARHAASSQSRATQAGASHVNKPVPMGSSEQEPVDIERPQATTRKQGTPRRSRPRSAGPGPTPRQAAAPLPATRTGSAGSGLPIPAYDTLAASQVVERLPSLSAAELEAVREHESATRRRRTVLHRIAQLNSERDGAPA